jgi:NADH-quinone oxidoreductase subunit L
VLFEHAPITLGVIAAVGAATALFAGTIGLVQNDIKRVLAYSTVSQLGYMFLAMGVGAVGAGIFHHYTHAFFKACLFLGSGAVIHALHGEQDIRHMGGLKKDLPITYWTFLVASLAIAGVPFLAGFFSKDEILFETFAHGHMWLWVVGAVTSLLTATYMFRLVYLTFHGTRRAVPAAADHGQDSHAPSPAHAAAPHGAGHAGGGHGHGGLHDAPPAMAVALIVLALGSVLAGYLGVPHALGGHNALGEWLHPSFSATSQALAACNVPVALPGAPAGMTLAECAPGDAVPAMASQAETAAEQVLPASALAAQEPPAAAGGHDGTAAEDQTALELTLMAVSSLIALLGIGLATVFWLKNPAIPASLAARFPGVHRLLLNKY